MTEHHHIPITEEETEYYIKKLNTEKAADEYGLRAEHLQVAVQSLSPILSSIINNILQTKTLPRCFFTGVITPVYKKGGKPITDRNSYRGITISSVIGKLLEKILLAHYDHLVTGTQNSLQNRFTEGAS